MGLVSSQPTLYDSLMKNALLAATAMASACWAVTASAERDPRAPLEDACWQQSFVENFDTLDLISPDNPDGQWKPAYIWGADIIINQELQYYVDPARVGGEYSPFSISEGVLSIEAKPTPPALRDAVAGQAYVSGVLTTEDGFSQQYGRFEAILKPPAGQGLWSAFWLLPSFEQWPQGVAVLPEIDVMEHIGHTPNTVHTTLHTNQNGPLESFPYDHTVREDLTRDFHRYSVVWTPEAVHWYLDRSHLVSHPTPRDFTRPVHFLLNLAVGGTWPGAPDATTDFPARFQIDQVTAWTPRPSC